MGTSKNIKLGIFILSGSVILLFMLIYFTARDMFKETDTYYVAYNNQSVSGLEVGSPVTYLGIDIGTVADIQIDPTDITRIVLKLSVETEIPIKEDAVADIVTRSITGMKAIEIKSGTNEAEVLAPSSYIRPGRGSLPGEISDKAEIIADKIEDILNNIERMTRPDSLTGISETLDDFGQMANSANKVFMFLYNTLDHNEDEFGVTMETVAQIIDSLLSLSRAMEKILGKFNAMIDKGEMEGIVNNTYEFSRQLSEIEIVRLGEEMTAVVDHTQQMLKKVEELIDQNSSDMLESQRLLRLTLRNLNEASRKIKDNPSVLIRRSETENLPDRRLQ
ncbi:MAG: MlaD family protein [Desulforhopalus sp.]